MTDEQKAQALALCGIRGVADLARRRQIPWVSIPGAPGYLRFVPNLADETGAVEGVLHRVLEKLVGEPVEVQREWRYAGDPKPETVGWCARTYDRRLGLGPTRLAAIVAALLALEVKQ